MLPGKMLPAPLLIFNEARRNIMQMSLNGAWTTAPKQGHQSLHLPLPPLCLHFYPPSLFVLLFVQFPCVLNCPPVLFNFFPNLPTFPDALIFPVLILVFASPAHPHHPVLLSRRRDCAIDLHFRHAG